MIGLVVNFLSKDLSVISSKGLHMVIVKIGVQFIN